MSKVTAAIRPTIVVKRVEIFEKMGVGEINDGDKKKQVKVRLIIISGCKNNQRRKKYLNIGFQKK